MIFQKLICGTAQRWHTNMTHKVKAKLKHRQPNPNPNPKRKAKFRATPKPFRVLELFKGTGSAGTAIKHLYPNAEVISLGSNAKWEPDIVCNK